MEVNPATSLVGRKSSATRSDYLVQPNFPLIEPIFHIPPCPNITKVPEPRPARKAPVAGYDMKTLRKQVEHLQTVRYRLSGLFQSAVGSGFDWFSAIRL
jgi:hypothetical protein